MFLLVDEHGTPLGSFKDRTEAEDTRQDALASEPDWFLAVVEIDAHGRRAGENNTQEDTNVEDDVPAGRTTTHPFKGVVRGEAPS